MLIPTKKTKLLKHYSPQSYPRKTVVKEKPSSGEHLGLYHRLTFFRKSDYLRYKSILNQGQWIIGWPADRDLE